MSGSNSGGAGPRDPHLASRLNLPDRPSLEQLRKQAKELLRHARAGDESAVARFSSIKRVAAGERPPALAHALLIVANDYGFPSWPKLVRHVESIVGSQIALGSRPLIRPVELRAGRRYRLADDAESTTGDVFGMFVAARDGDLAGVRRAVARFPALATVEYNYTPPIHFAAREGHRDIVEFLFDRGADPAYRSYPFKESLLTFAEDRGHHAVAELLRVRLSRRFALAAESEALIAAATTGDIAAVERLLADRPGIAKTSNETGDTALHHAAERGYLDIARALAAAGANVDAVRGDGRRPIHCALMPHWFFEVLGVAARRGQRALVELLLERGADPTASGAPWATPLAWAERKVMTTS